MLQGSGTIWKETFSRSGNILQMHIMEDCMEAPLMVLKMKKNKKIKKLYLKKMHFITAAIDLEGIMGNLS